MSSPASPSTPRVLPTTDQLVEIVAPLAAERGAVVEVRRLTGGMFAVAHTLEFADGSRAVIKVSDADPARLCRYEVGIARTEAETFEVLGERGLPVPAVLLTDFSRERFAADVVVTSHLAGTPWNVAGLDEASDAVVRRELGGLMARLHRVGAPAFGYPAPEAGLRAADWRTAFTLMVEGVLQDAADTGTEVSADAVRAALARHGGALDVVTRAAIVHNDLWPANLFLDARGDEVTVDGEREPRIVGLIDTERTVWGDLLLDLVGADQFGLWHVDPDLLAGNTAAGGVLAAELASPTGAARFALYRLYYSLVLVAEIPIRGYEGEWVAGHRSAAEAILAAALDLVAEPAITALPDAER
ncbi:phosphotransferase family protein [Miniimonas arenae]|uniref:phosphotransferase family protein n=1 Tax=Miniimonas arenae TaxID=676201 RepID=UPI0028AED5D0|nr:aminoglycoside phosphotransferase family protein [Miniimonas arenae]